MIGIGQKGEKKDEFIFCARCNLLDRGIAVVHSRQGEPNEN